MKKLKICCISDTHSLHNQVIVPECDYLFHAGDLTGNGSFRHLIDFCSWFKRQPARYKIAIAGNHDEWCQNNSLLTKQLFADAGLHYLENDVFVLENGMTLFGSPYTPRFLDWFFMYYRDEMYPNVWSKVPDNIDIILTHGPMNGIMDGVNCHRSRPELGQEHVGCEGLKKRVGELKNLKYLIHGHIHAGYGKDVLPGSLNGKVSSVQIVNCSICDEDYETTNKPIMLKV